MEEKEIRYKELKEMAEQEGLQEKIRKNEFVKSLEIDADNRKVSISTELTYWGSEALEIVEAVLKLHKLNLGYDRTVKLGKHPPYDCCDVYEDHHYIRIECENKKEKVRNAFKELKKIIDEINKAIDVFNKAALIEEKRERRRKRKEVRKILKKAGLL